MNPRPFEQQLAVITGAASGIGLACAAAFLQEGARVTLVARQAETLDAAKRKLLEKAPSAVVHVCAGSRVLPVRWRARACAACRRAAAARRGLPP